MRTNTKNQALRKKIAEMEINEVQQFPVAHHMVVRSTTAILNSALGRKYTTKQADKYIFVTRLF